MTTVKGEFNLLQTYKGAKKNQNRVDKTECLSKIKVKWRHNKINIILELLKQTWNLDEIRCKKRVGRSNAALLFQYPIHHFV